MIYRNKAALRAAADPRMSAVDGGFPPALKLCTGEWRDKPHPTGKIGNQAVKCRSLPPAHCAALRIDLFEAFHARQWAFYSRSTVFVFESQSQQP